MAQDFVVTLLVELVNFCGLRTCAAVGFSNVVHRLLVGVELGLGTCKVCRSTSGYYRLN